MAFLFPVLDAAHIVVARPLIRSHDDPGVRAGDKSLTKFIGASFRPCTTGPKSSRWNCLPCEDSYLQALARLPEMSVILYPDPEDDERGIYVPVEPCDPFTEAVRSALQIDSEVVFIEPDLSERPHVPDAYPDPYAIPYRPRKVYRGLPGLSAAAHGSGPPMPRAWRGNCRGGSQAQVLVVVSLNLLDPLLDAMEIPQDPPPARKHLEVRLLNPHPDCLAEITVEFPYLQHRYEVFPAGDERWAADFLERPRVQFDLLRDAEAKYVVHRR